MTSEQMWIAFGLMGQFLFTSRFVVQWLSSEKQKKSVVPASFWFLSIGGAAILLLYAIHRRDLVSPYVSEAPDGPLVSPDADFELGRSWFVDRGPGSY